MTATWLPVTQPEGPRVSGDRRTGWNASVSFTGRTSRWLILVNTDPNTSLCVCISVVVKRDIQESDEEAVRVKEQSILELGGLLAKTGQAAGNRTWLLVIDAHAHTFLSLCHTVSLQCSEPQGLRLLALLSFKKHFRSKLDTIMSFDFIVCQEKTDQMGCISFFVLRVSRGFFLGNSIVTGVKVTWGCYQRCIMGFW